ncbi:MAG: hypothetical protein IPN76_08245 [Saprospiraceae bacterium]|nr:hypothetical protein [Saprospiraceae bacterium]
MKKLIEHSHCELNMVCIVFFFFIGAIAPSILLAQGYPACWPSETPTNCSSNLGYAPDPFVPEHTPIKYIKVVLHVFHKEDTANLGQYMVHPTNPDNFTADHKDYLKSWFTHSDGINGVLGQSMR